MNLCCLVNLFLSCEVCGGRWCRDHWFNRAYESHSYSKEGDRVCQNVKLLTINVGGPPPSVDGPFKFIRV